MTINRELEAEILRLHHAEKWKIGNIATQLGVHHSVVRRVLERDGKSAGKTKRQRMVDPFIPFIIETLGKYPRLNASRLYRMVQERGYPGKPAQFRAIVAELRGIRHHEPYFRLRTLAGEQAQVDWGHFGRLQIGRATRPLMAFAMVLSHSRALFLRFFLSQNLSNFLHGHQMAYNWFEGLPRVCLYDNLKSVVLERAGRAIRFNSQFMEFAGHYRFELRPVAIGRGNEKGRVERAIRYVRTNFFAARRFKDLDDLNSQALRWCETASLERRWPEDSRRTVQEVFLEEKKQLLELPANPFPCDERCEVSIGKSPYARFDLNDYSVPHTLVQKPRVVFASLDTVRILDGNQVVATHSRSYDRSKQIECPEHLEALRTYKTQAGQHRRTDLLAHAAPSSKMLLEQLAKLGLPLTRATRELTQFLHTYGAAALEAAISEALSNRAPHLHAVRLILERYRHEARKSPALPVLLPDDPRVKNLIVKLHHLSSYDHIQHQAKKENDETDD